MCQKTYVCLNEIQDVNVNVFMGNKYPIEILKREKNQMYDFYILVLKCFHILAERSSPSRSLIKTENFKTKH